MAVGAPGPSVGRALRETVQRFSPAPSDEKKRVELAETMGADGRRLLEWVYAEETAPWLRELEAIQTLRQVWVQHYHASEQGTPWRAEGELPPCALLITSPYDVEARYSRKKSTAWTGGKLQYLSDKTKGCV